MTPPAPLPLSDAPVGTRVRIRRLTTAPEVARRLREVGLSEQAVISCIHKGHGNIICAVQSTRIGIDHRLASKIFVSPSE